jgi:hypothetical protein
MLDGSRCQLRNTLLVPGVLPLFRVNPAIGFGFIIIPGNNTQGGVGGSGIGGSLPSVSPLVDVAGGTFVVGGSSGGFKDNSLTDSVGGGFVLIRARDDSFNGIANASEDFAFPAIPLGLVQISVEGRPRRYVEDLGGAVVTPADSPWIAFYNEFVPCDPMAAGVNAINVEAPSAKVSRGEQFTVKDALGNAAIGNNILISAQPGETLDGSATATITNARGAKTWIADGYGNWMLSATV